MKALFGVATILAFALTARAEDPPKPKGGEKPEVKIYDEKADAKALIDGALASAKRENRRVLIQWGGNWCSWCLLLHNKFTTDRDLAKTLRYEYDVIHIDSKNEDLIKKYGADIEKHGVPFLTVLDADGKVLVNQETESFETKVDGKNGHDPKKLQEFLDKHKAEPKKAADVLAAALAEAAKTDRKVFLHFGAPWCGWCLKLDAWLARADVAPVFGKDYVEVKIDQDRMAGAKEVFAKYHPDMEGGIPWFAILDAQGKAVATSDGPKGNIGFPAEPQEIEHFIKMLKSTRSKLTDDDVSALEKLLTPPAKK
jgi:thiol-disulfide isomerase/thioredoxin